MPLSFPPIYHLFIHLSDIRSYGVSWSKTFCTNNFVYKCSVCNKLLVRVKACGFWYAINTGLSQKHLLDILLLLQVIETDHPLQARREPGHLWWGVALDFPSSRDYRDRSLVRGRTSCLVRVGEGAGAAQLGPQISTHPSTQGSTLGLYGLLQMDVSRPQLHQNNWPRYCHLLQLGPGWHHCPGWHHRTLPLA